MAKNSFVAEVTFKTKYEKGKKINLIFFNECEKVGLINMFPLCTSIFQIFTYGSV